MSIYNWLDKRLDIRPGIEKVTKHPVPVWVNWLYCFGGITFFLFVLQVITGMFLMLYYVPSPDHAYDSVQYITKTVRFGAFIRGIHHWSATLLVVMVVIHMLRVFWHGAYKTPRELNWITGVCLFLMIMGFGFTGYLLPWDQKAYWATTVGTNIAGTVPVVGPFILKLMRGGTDLGAITLVRFFQIHVALLPAITITFLVAHFFMIRRQGINRPF
ncbi:MAG: DUF4405 domain-containing protein [Ruminiclostridium sp.]|nr:DUF4405 domain-containing protein [Ruminiclostridium sp.]